MGDIWMGFVIGGLVLVVVLMMVIVFYWFEWCCVWLLWNFDYCDCWFVVYGKCFVCRLVWLLCCMCGVC